MERFSDRAHRLGLVGVLLLVASLTGGCYRTVGPPELIDGVWVGTDGDRQLAVQFTTSHITVHASIHILQDGRKLTEKNVDRVELDGHGIVVRWDNGRWYRGSSDAGWNRMEGVLSDLDGSRRDLELLRVEPSTVAGLHVRPEPVLSTPYEWTQPPGIEGDWQIATPEEVGLVREPLEELIDAIVAGEAGEIHSLLIVRDGKLVLEEYFHGWGRDDLHDVSSCTYGVASLLIGIALDRGKIGDVTDPLLDFFPDMRRTAHPGWVPITLEHLLTMTAGRRDPNERRVLLADVDDLLFRDTLGGTLIDDPGTRWSPNDRQINFLSGILSRTTGIDADEFAARHLFAPLGIESYEWRRGPGGGLPWLHAGLRLRPRDMAKLGQLLLDEGRRGDRQVVSAEWIRRSTSERLETPISRDEQYGYLWWLPPLPEELGEGRVIVAAGEGSQFIYASSDLYTVFVLTGGNHFNRKLFLPPQVLAEYLPEAFKRGQQP